MLYINYFFLYKLLSLFKFQAMHKLLGPFGRRGRSADPDPGSADQGPTSADAPLGGASSDAGKLADLQLI